MSRRPSAAAPADPRVPVAARRLLLVHAHPDDECISTGGTMAKYAADGAHVCLVTCTNGELGEIAEVPDLGPPEELRPRLAEIRREELAESCRRLGCSDLRLLGYHDSGMDGTPSNRDPVAFVNQDLDEVTDRIVAVVREVRPQVLITYNDYGFYGHPDHIRAHRAATAAVERAADPAHAPELGAAHEVAKLYHTAVPKSALRRAREIFPSSPRGDDDIFPEEEVERIGTDDEAVTTEIDVTAHVPQKIAALEAHRTQYGTIRAFLGIPEEFRTTALGTEYFVLARSAVERPQTPERDLFAGLEERAVRA